MKCLITLTILLSLSSFTETSRDALNEFNELQKRIINERQTVLKESAKLKAEIKSLKAELNQLEKDDVSTKLSEVEKRRYEIVDILNDVANVHSSIPAQIQGDTIARSIRKSFELIENCQNQTKEVTVYNEQGQQLTGNAIISGPMMWFEDKGVVVKTGDILQLKSEDTIPFEDVKSGKVAIPVYFSAKAAFNSHKESLIEHLKKGKVAMIPMLILALFATITALIRTLKLTGVVNRLYTEEITEIVKILKSEGKDKAVEAASTLRRPLANVISEGIKNCDLSKEHLEEVLYERITLEVPKLEKGLAGLAVSASTAPLLGLLGTVTGMIHTFNMITTYGSGNAAILSGGISEALVTTEVGLVIAIPALLVHAWLGRKVSKAIALTQKASLSFVNLLKIK